MKNFILSMITGIVCLCCSSCASSQSITADYDRVYFDYVVSGHVIGDDYVYDGTYSYHILSAVPVNVYWELYPCRYEVYLYTSQMVRIRLFEWTRRSIYYNRTHHNYYRFDDRHRPPMRPHDRYYHNNHRGTYYHNQHRLPHTHGGVKPVKPRQNHGNGGGRRH